MVRIAIVNSSSFGRYFPEHIEKISSFGKVKRFYVDYSISGRRLAEMLKGYEIVIASVTPKYDKTFFEKKDGDLLLISRHGIGVDNIDLAAATASGVIVTRVPGKVEQEAMAEHTVSLLLTVLRKINIAGKAVKENKWSMRADFVGSELRGKVVGVIGFGNIGRRVAEILKYGFHAKVLAYDPYLSFKDIKACKVEPVDFKTLLRSSDIITLHASLNQSSYHMIRGAEFGLMKKGVILVNTARGELIETKSLIQALKSGKVLAAGLDVVEGEPVTSKQHPLLKYNNVVITPHIGAYTYEALKKMGDKVVEDVERVINGKIPKEVVNTEVLRVAIAKVKKWN